MLFKNQEVTVLNVVQKPRGHCTECCSKKNALLRDREKDFLKKYQNNG